MICCIFTFANWTNKMNRVGKNEIFFKYLISFPNFFLDFDQIRGFSLLKNIFQFPDFSPFSQKRGSPDPNSSICPYVCKCTSMSNGLCLSDQGAAYVRLQQQGVLPSVELTLVLFLPVFVGHPLREGRPMWHLRFHRLGVVEMLEPVVEAVVGVLENKRVRDVWSDESEAFIRNTFTFANQVK